MAQGQGSVVIRGIEFPAGVSTDEIRAFLRTEGLSDDQIAQEFTRAFPTEIGMSMTPAKAPEEPAWQGPIQPPPPRTWADTGRDVGAGAWEVGKGGIQGAANLVGRGGELVHKLPGFSSMVDALYGTPGLSQRAFQDVRQQTTPENTLQSLGSGGMQTALLAGPVGAISRGTQALPWLGRNAPELTRWATNIGTSAGTEALQGGDARVGAAFGALPGLGQVSRITGRGIGGMALREPSQEAVENVLNRGLLWTGSQSGLGKTQRRIGDLVTDISGKLRGRTGNVPIRKPGAQSPEVAGLLKELSDRGEDIPAALTTIAGFRSNPALAPRTARGLFDISEGYRLPLSGTDIMAPSSQMRRALATSGKQELGRVAPRNLFHNVFQVQPKLARNLNELEALRKVKFSLSNAPPPPSWMPSWRGLTGGLTETTIRRSAPAVAQGLYSAGRRSESDTARAMILAMLMQNRVPGQPEP